MDTGEHEEGGGGDHRDLLIHSKFWKAKRGSQQSLEGAQQPEIKRLTPLTSTPDHPFHSRSPRRALSSISNPSSGTNYENLAATSSHLLNSSQQTPAGVSTFHTHSEVFRFDSADRERYLCSAISEEEEVFSPPCGSPTSSTRSYDLVLDSPSITISGLHLGSTESPPPPLHSRISAMDSQKHLSLSRGPGAVAMATNSLDSAPGLFPSSPISPLTPNTPLSPSPLFSDQIFQQGLLAELYRRRCHSDSELPLTPEACKSDPKDLSVKRSHPKLTSRLRRAVPHPLKIPSKGGSLESDQSSPQDSPLDLSVKGSGSVGSSESLSSRFLSSLPVTPTSATFSPVAVIRGDIASSSTRNSVALRYNLDVSPVVEQMPPGADMAFVCPMCGQMFSLHDRLAKHMASRHKSKPHDPNKSYPCDICHRSFARSDMLTRHMRLHTGVKPYTCRVCGQVFSRSDHLSTHQRTHTGEKPYKCPQCPYSACRRDMITRHLRTHTRNSSSSSGEPTPSLLTSSSGSDPLGALIGGGEGLDGPIKMEVVPIYSRPPSSASSFAPDSPSGNSPALNLSSLSVHSPSSPSSQSSVKE